MKREEWKARLPLIEAFAGGRAVQFFADGEWVEKEDFSFDCSPDSYKIKPVEIYRAYRDVDEIDINGVAYVKSVLTGDIYRVNALVHQDNRVYMGAEGNYIDLGTFCSAYTRLDGSPLGVKVED